MSSLSMDKTNSFMLIALISRISFCSCSLFFQDKKIIFFQHIRYAAPNSYSYLSKVKYCSLIKANIKIIKFPFTILWRRQNVVQNCIRFTYSAPARTLPALTICESVCYTFGRAAFYTFYTIDECIYILSSSRQYYNQVIMYKSRILFKLNLIYL